MCGFAGYYQPFAPVGSERAGQIAARMIAPILHRGPDDQGVFDDADGAFAMGFRRLAIIDLSKAGHQPMVSSSGRFAIAYNGEVYNAEALRPALTGIGFRGRSDTEVILESFEHFGIEATLSRMVGMFALCLWDRHNHRLILARDRLGIKPLFWSLRHGCLLFGSQPKCFFGHDGFEPEIDHDAMHAYLRFGYVPAPHAIFRHTQKLEPGCWLEIGADLEPRVQRYWDLQTLARQGMASPLAIGDDEAQDQLHDLIDDAVAMRMVSDVPLGAMLSGGIDSSTIVAMMQRHASRPVKTFSIGFSEAGFDEAPHARAVASHLGTDHHELYVGAPDALALVPKLAGWYDEPFADSSAIPTMLLSAMTQEHVTVALSGDGGDELFAGYSRYREIAGLFARCHRIPGWIRHLLATGLRATAPMTAALENRFPGLEPRFRADYRCRKLADLLDRGPSWMMRHIVGHWQSPELIAAHGFEPIDPVWLGRLGGRGDDLYAELQLADMLTYLPDDILAKVDRASMATSLEARVPLLDHRIVEFIWQLPAGLRSNQFPPKKLLRSVLARYVPDALIDRPKRGFSVPIHAWLRGPLRDWAEALLDPHRLKEAGLVDVTRVRRAWQQHLDGDADWRFPIWNLLMLEAWRERWLEGSGDLNLQGQVFLSEPRHLSTDNPAVTA